MKAFNFANYFKFPQASSAIKGFIPHRVQNFTYSNFFTGGKSYEITSDFSYTEWWKSGTKFLEVTPTFNYWQSFKRGSKIKEITTKKNYVDLMKRGSEKFGKVNVDIRRIFN